MKKGQSPSVSKNINNQKQQQPSQGVGGAKKASEYKNKYREIEQIGKGTSGTVFLVKSKSDKKFYIAKKIILTNLNDQEKLAVEQELVLLRKLRHPHIVGYKESFIETYYMIIIMEYCEQGDLSFHIKQKQKEKDHFDERVILNWFVQLTMALDFVHEQHVLHRDVKCSNIFLTASGSIKLGDFGISKVLHSTADKAQTLIGTPYYLSPEVCENQPYTYQSDIWALGCVLFEMCALQVLPIKDHLQCVLNFIQYNLMIQSASVCLREFDVSCCKDYQRSQSKYSQLIFQRSQLSYIVIYYFIQSYNIILFIINKQRILLAKKPENRPRTKQIFAFPFVIEVMKDFVTSKGLKQELRSLPIKKTQLHIKKETKNSDQQQEPVNSVKQIQRKNSHLSANRQSTPKASQQKAIASQNNPNTIQKTTEQPKQSVSSTKVQRKNSNDIKRMEELIQKQMKDVKNEVQKKISEVKGKKMIPPTNLDQKATPSSKPSTASSSQSTQNSVLSTPSQQSDLSKKQSPQNQPVSKQIITPQTGHTKKKSITNLQEASSNKSTNSSKNSQKTQNNNDGDEYDRKIQEMMNNMQNKVKQEYAQIQKESPPKKSPIINNSKAADNYSSPSIQQNQNQNIIQPQNAQKINQYQPTPTQLKQNRQLNEKDQKYNSNYENKNYESSQQIEEDIKLQNTINHSEKSQLVSKQIVQEVIQDNSQKLNYHFSQKGGYNSLLQDSNVSLNLSLTNDSVFNNTAFKSNLPKKQGSIATSVREQPTIEEEIIENDCPETQQRSQAPSDISEYKNEFLNSEFCKSNKSDDGYKFQTVISEHIQTQIMPQIPPEIIETSKYQNNNNNNNNKFSSGVNDSFDFDELPQRDDYIDTDEDNEYEEDFEVSSEEGDSLGSGKEKNDFRLTRKNLDKELDEVIEMYKSQLMSNTNPEEYNKFKHMLNMSEIPEASVEFSTGELSNKMKLPEQTKSQFKKK